MPSRSNFEVEQMPSESNAKAEHQTMNLLVEGEPSGTNLKDNNARGNDFHDCTDNISIIVEVWNFEKTFEDVHLEFDHAFPPLENRQEIFQNNKFLVI